MQELEQRARRLAAKAKAARKAGKIDEEKYREVMRRAKKMLDAAHALDADAAPSDAEAGPGAGAHSADSTEEPVDGTIASPTMTPPPFAEPPRLVRDPDDTPATDESTAPGGGGESKGRLSSLVDRLRRRPKAADAA